MISIHSGDHRTLILQDGVVCCALADGVLEGSTGRGYRFHRYPVVRAGLVQLRIRIWNMESM